MIPPHFEYYRATSVADAISALRAAGEDARPLAGGQSLIPMLKLRFAEPTMLVDLAGIGELSEIRHIDSTANASDTADTGSTVRIGSMATHYDVAQTVGALTGMQSFADVGQLIGDLQIRSIGTFGGSIAHADPAGDRPAVALAHRATIEIASTSGVRKVAAEDFFLGAFTTKVAPAELITAISIPTDAEASTYIKISDPASGYARAGVCAVVTNSLHGPTFSLAATGAASQPFRLRTLEQAAANGATKTELEEAAHADIPPGSLADREPYRGQLLRVAARRAAQLVSKQMQGTH